MSFRAIVSVIVHAESFRNIDLFEQGIYMINFKVYHNYKEVDCFASPFALHYSDELNPRASSHRLVNPCIEDTNFRTRGFLVKYSDEDVSLNDIAIFMAELEVSQGYQEVPLLVKAELLFSDLNLNLLDNQVIENPPSLDKFSIVSSTEVQITMPLEGKNQFCPLVFDSDHACQVNTSLHAILIDFRYRPSPLVSLDPKNSIETEMNLPKKLAEQFFPDCFQVSDQEINSVYNYYVMHLIEIYNKNCEFLQAFVEGNLSSQAKKLLPELPKTITQRSTPFSESLLRKDLLYVSEEIFKNIQELASRTYLMIFVFVEVIKTYPQAMCLVLQLEYNQKLKNHWSNYIFRNVAKVNSFTEVTHENLGEHHNQIARNFRRTFKSSTPLEAHQTDCFPLTCPVLFHDIFTKSVLEEGSLWDPNWLSYMHNPDYKRKGIHLIVLVHGFQGSSFDVRRIRNNIAMVRPDTVLMCSTLNEGETEGEIIEMGRRLASEIKSYIEEWCPMRLLKKISFVGHSLGGLIIRAALPFLSEHSGLMHFFMSFSSPHLGYMYSNSSLFNAGMWVLKKWRKSACLAQLSMADSYDMRECFLYKLSQETGLDWFKHLCLVSSYQDKYSPFESARIEIGPEAMKETQKAKVYTEMAENILNKLSIDKVHRIDVNYLIKGQSFDSWIGRSAHIEMLENDAMMQMLVYACAQFFA